MIDQRDFTLVIGDRDKGEEAMKIKLALVASALALSCMSATAEDNVTLEGTLVSSSCYLGSPNHPTGNDMGGRKGCGTFCLRRGDPAGLVTKENAFHVLVAASVVLAPYVGSQVRVTGVDHNGDIAVRKVELENNGTWKEIDLKAKPSK